MSDMAKTPAERNFYSDMQRVESSSKTLALVGLSGGVRGL